MGPGLNESLTNHQLDSLFSLIQVQERKRTKPKQNKREETAKASWNHTCRLPILPPMAGRGANPTDFGAGFVYVQNANRRLHLQQQTINNKLHNLATITANYHTSQFKQSACTLVNTDTLKAVTVSIKQIIKNEIMNVAPFFSFSFFNTSLIILLLKTTNSMSGFISLKCYYCLQHGLV